MSSFRLIEKNIMEDGNKLQKNLENLKNWHESARKLVPIGHQHNVLKSNCGASEFQ